MSRRLLAAMLEAGFVFAEDGDGFVVPADQALEGGSAYRFRITVSGRLSVLSCAQVLALTTRVDASGRFGPDVPWPTVQALVGLGLAQYRDASGQVQPGDGDTGVSGPVNGAFRTPLGSEVAGTALGERPGARP